ncbi:MAG: tyrosine--tRNA ligase [Zestosphaera sp.]
MDVETCIKLATRGASEVVTMDELRELFETGGGSGYLGFEPSGVFHVGWFVWALKFKDLVEAGLKMNLLAATWHAWVNDKLGGDMDLIRVAARHVATVLDTLGIEGRYRLVYAEDLMNNPNYWATLLRVAKSTSLARIKRALTILGRKADEGESDFSKLIYPLMQVTDIFELGIDVALGGTDQRRAHMLQRDVAEKLRRRKVVAIHTPLIPSLQGFSRMDMGGVGEEVLEELAMEYKMSKSKPESAIFVTDADEVIRDKVLKAYCPLKVVEGNPILDIAKHLIFRGEEKRFTIERPQKFGGSIDVWSQEELVRLYADGSIHPLDLKNAVANYLIELIRPIRERLLSNEEYSKAIRVIMNAVSR